MITASVTLLFDRAQLFCSAQASEESSKKMANNVEGMDLAGSEQGASQPASGTHASVLEEASLQAFVDKIFTKVSLKCLDEIGESAEFTKSVVTAIRGKEATGNEFATVKDLAKATRLLNAMVPHMTKIVFRKENMDNCRYLDTLNTSKAEASQVTELKEYAKDLESRITALESQALDNTTKFNDHLNMIR